VSGLRLIERGRNRPSEEIMPGIRRIDLLVGVILSKSEHRSYLSLPRIDHIYSFSVNL